MEYGSALKLNGKCAAKIKNDLKSPDHSDVVKSFASLIYVSAFVTQLFSCALLIRTEL